jgi:cytochrome c-type biogenesis protein CcmH/NrfG
MPPWQAEPGEQTFVGQTRPSDAEVDTLRRWAAGGAPEGSAPGPAAPPGRGGWQLGEPDLVVTMPEAYALPAEGKDVFRVFVLPLGGNVLRYVRGLEFRPGNPAVHHVNIRIDRTGASRERDTADPSPGYDGLLSRTALFPDGHFLGWTPGQTAPLLPAGLAWPLAPQSDLVLQAHMQPTGKREPIRLSVGLYFTTTPPVPRLAMLRLGRQDLDIKPGEVYTSTDSYVLPVDVTLQAVQPHAHYRARDVLGEAVLPGGRRLTLLHIRDWNFRWQHLYRYESPPALPAGTVISMRYTYDNSANNPRNPVQPPARAEWGQRSAEEMGDFWLQVMTRSEADLLTLNRDFRPKAVREDLVGYESLIRRTPDDAGLHDDAAVLYLELGAVRDAIVHWRDGVRLRPQLPSAHFNLATALALIDDRAGAHQAFADALRLDPGYVRAHLGFSRLLIVEGDPANGREHARTAVRLAPLDPDGHYVLGLAERALGDRRSAVTAWREAVRLAPRWVTPAIDLAWTLATSDGWSANDLRDAARLAEQAVVLTERRDPAVLDVLAVSLAATGDFERAAAIETEAIALEQRPPVARDMSARLELFRQRRAFKN